MAAQDVMGAVCDKLVGGMMFHSDHADLCRLLGVEWLARAHEDGYLHDSKAHAKMRRKYIRHVGMMASAGRQERTRTLDQWRGRRMADVQCDTRPIALRDAMRDWCEWETGAADTYRTAYQRLLSCGHMALAEEARELAVETEDELSRARAMWVEMDACGFDMPHVMEMGGDETWPRR